MKEEQGISSAETAFVLKRMGRNIVLLGLFSLFWWDWHYGMSWLYDLPAKYQSLNMIIVLSSSLFIAYLELVIHKWSNHKRS